MRVVHVNFDAVKIGGASIAMLRTIDAQRKAGIDAVIACRCKPEGRNCVLLRPSFSGRVCEVGSKLLLHLVYGHHAHQTGLISMGVADQINALRPDVVQLNWLQANTIGIRELLKIKAPIVWFTHDLWPMLGLEGYPRSDWYKKGAPADGSIINHWAWDNKCRVVQSLKGRLSVVSPSEWARDCVAQSIVFRDIPARCIHYPVSESLEMVSKRFAGAPKKKGENFVVLFGTTTGIKARVKGWDRLMKAVASLPQKVKDRIRIRVFGQTGDDLEENGVRITFLGRMNLEELVLEYRNADLFAFPSRQETWGQTKTEALCCGTPVIAFDETACANGIRHKENGWVSPPDDVVDYANGILWFYNRWENDLHLHIEGEPDKYSTAAIGRLWKDYYEELLKSNG